MAFKIPSQLVETDWLAEHLNNRELRIVDCSVAGTRNDDGSICFTAQRDAWEQAHIPGASFVDISGELSKKDHDLPFMLPDSDEFAKVMRGIGIGDSSGVVLYDRTNHAWAARVWWMLRVYGFDNAAVLNGGFNKWQAEGRPTQDEPPQHPPADSLAISRRSHLIADKSEVLDALEDETTTLLNSLPRPFFTGEIAAYGRAGRIPGSEHLSCEAIVDPDTHAYLDLDALGGMIEETDIRCDRRVITYCGGGIAASSTAFILTLLGHEDVAVYDGSLSEWCADTELPMETGEPISD